MYRPFKAFDMQKKFNVSDSELKSLGLVTTKEQLEDIFNRYAEFILPKYNGRIEGDELPYFSLPENQATVSAVFAKHAYNEQPRPEILPDAENALSGWNTKNFYFYRDHGCIRAVRVWEERNTRA